MVQRGDTVYGFLRSVGAQAQAESCLRSTVFNSELREKKEELILHTNLTDPFQIEN